MLHPAPCHARARTARRGFGRCAGSPSGPGRSPEEREGGLWLARSSGSVSGRRPKTSFNSGSERRGCRRRFDPRRSPRLSGRPVGLHQRLQRVPDGSSPPPLRHVLGDRSAQQPKIPIDLSESHTSPPSEVIRPPSKAASRSSGAGVWKGMGVVAESVTRGPPPLVSLKATRPYTGESSLFSTASVNNPG